MHVHQVRRFCLTTLLFSIDVSLVEGNAGDSVNVGNGVNIGDNGNKGVEVNEVYDTNIGFDTNVVTT